MLYAMAKKLKCGFVICFSFWSDFVVPNQPGHSRLGLSNRVRSVRNDGEIICLLGWRSCAVQAGRLRRHAVGIRICSELSSSQCWAVSLRITANCRVFQQEFVIIFVINSQSMIYQQSTLDNKLLNYIGPGYTQHCQVYTDSQSKVNKSKYIIVVVTNRCWHFI